MKLNPVFSKTKHIAFLGVITMLCALAYVGSDIYAPSLPYIAQDLNTDVSMVKLTMSVYLLTLGVFQFFAGILSDKMGRLKLLKISIVVFILGSIGCFFAPNIEMLLFFRFIQALGASAGNVTGQAIIADLYDKRKTGQFFSIILPLVALSPAIAPIVGGFLQDHVNWRASFGVLVGYGVCVLVLMAMSIIPKVPPISRPFSAAEKLAHGAEAPIHFVSQLKIMFKNAHFLGHTLFIMGAFATYFCFIVITPFVFHNHGLSALAVGYAFSVEAVVYMAASFTARWFSKKHLTHDQLVLIGLVLTVVGAIIVSINLVLPYTHVALFLIPFYVITVGNGFIMPFSTASAMAFYPRKSGFVSGLLSSAQLGGAGLTTAIIAGAGDEHNVLSIAAIALTVSVGCLIYFFVLMRTNPNEGSAEH
jgi:DHA1 family bicyclomycin/chloramphenicol resistance-like MFS transporter